MDIISKENGFTEKISRAKVSELQTNIFCVPVKVCHSSKPEGEKICVKNGFFSIFLNLKHPSMETHEVITHEYFLFLTFLNKFNTG